MKFGIGAKIVLLLIAVVALTAAVLGYSLLETSSQIVMDHEIVDLNDETSNAAYELSSYLYRIRRGMREISQLDHLDGFLSADVAGLPNSLSSFYGELDKQQDENQQTKRVKLPSNYLAVEMWLRERGKLKRLFSEQLQGELLVAETSLRSPGIDDFPTVLKQFTEPLSSKEMFISDVGSVKIRQKEKEFDNDSKKSEPEKISGNTSDRESDRSIDAIWCGFRLAKADDSRELFFAALVDLDAPPANSQQSEGTSGPGPAGGKPGDSEQSDGSSTRKESQEVRKDEQSPIMAIRNSPRHLNVLANCRPMAKTSTGNSQPIQPATAEQTQISLLFLDGTDSFFPNMTDLKATFGELYEKRPRVVRNEQGPTLVVFERDDMSTRNIELTQPLVFRQSKPIPYPSLRSQLAAKIRKLQRDRVGEFQHTRIAMSGANEYFIRLLADSEKSISGAMQEVDRIITETRNEMGTTETPDTIRISWRDSVKCKTCAPCFVLFRVGSAGLPGNNRYFGLFRSVFLEELQADVKNELSTARNAALAIVGIVAILGFGASLYLTRPLKKITLAAQEVGKINFDSTDEYWQREIDEIGQMLPVHRSDEIGVLAQSLDQMIGQMLAGQARLHRLNTDLDRRVTERTHELQQANEKLLTARDKTEELSRAKDAFLASVSHELRNPLNQVSGFCQLLELTDLNEEQMADLRKIKQAGSQLLALINDILDYQKIVMGGITLEPEQLAVPELLEEVRDGLKFPNEENGNELIVDWSNDVGEIYADKQRLRQVLLNLAGNASKFTRNGRVHVHARRVSGDNGSDDIEFSIADTGRGMTPEEQVKLFTPFTKLASKQGNRTGTGLGLVISKGLSESMGGSIRLSSEYGKGSTFTVQIPTITSESARSSVYRKDFAAVTGGSSVVSKPAGPDTSLSDRIPSEIPAGNSRSKSKQRRSILVIDDDPDVREVMSRYLGMQGYEVETAADGVKGLELARKLLPAAITLDVSMPGLDGWAVLAALKTDHVLADIPVIMVTMVDNPPRGQIMGADEFVVKPIDWSRLSRILARHTTPEGSQSILIVDDDEMAREVLRRNLESDGWNVLESTNGKEALDILAETTPAAILLDLMMPVMDGFEFLERRSADDRYIPVIVVTAKDPTPQEFAWLCGRVARVLQKGQYTQEQFLEEIHRWVQDKAPAAAGTRAGGTHA